MRVVWLLALSLFCSVIAQPAISQQKLRIAIAANFLPVANDLERLFESAQPVDLEFISGSSGSLTAQILNHAPYDAFLSANLLYARRIEEEGLGRSPTEFCRGKLAIWLKRAAEDPTRIDAVVREVGPKSIAIANPELAPYGTMASQWLEDHGISTGRVVLGENVGQVNQYILSSSVEAAFTAASAMHSDALRDLGMWVTADEEYSIPHYAQTLSNANSPALAKDFVKFLTGDSAQEVLRKFGYLSPD